MSTDFSSMRPYIGPAPFLEEDSDNFFGREKDVETLRGMLRTERIVLLHSPSGAGKTSLIRAGLIPRMRKDEFRVLPPVHVGHPLPAHTTHRPESNRYVYSVIHSLETALRKGEGESADAGPMDGLEAIPLNTYFAHRSALRRGEERLLLLFDQFEELFTLSPHDRRGRLSFFSELGTALQDKQIWALFAIREEYVGALDAYSRFLPNHFAARYHLDFLSRNDGEKAVIGPLERLNIPYEPQVVKAILADLGRTGERGQSNVDVEEDGALEFEDLSDVPLIDPLHLQLVCTQLWDRVQRLKLETVSREAFGEVGGVAGLSPVDAALMQYYDLRIQEAPKTVALGEREIRDWVEEELIQDGRTRRVTLADPDPDSELTLLQRYLEAEHILRASLRGNSKWYELAHDRLVFLVLRSNQEWYERNLAPFERQARRWGQLGEPADFPALPWRIWRDHDTGLLGRSKVGPRSEWERKYLAFCRNQTWKRAVRIPLGLLVIFALLSLALYQLWQGQQTENTARRLQGLAMQQRYTNQNHDTALLLAVLAGKYREKAANQWIRRMPLVSGLLVPPLSSIEVDRAIWTTLEAYPFSRTLPLELLQGRPAFLSQCASVVHVPVKHEKGWRITHIDLAGNRFQMNEACENSIQVPFPGGEHSAVLDPLGKAIRIVDADCRVLGGLSLPDGAVLMERAPVIGQEGEYLAAFLTDGSLAVCHVGSEDHRLLGIIPPGSVSCEDPRGTVAVSSVAFKGSRVLVGDEWGGVRLFDLAQGSPVLQHCFPAFEAGWPLEGWLKVQRKYRKIVALALSDDATPWLTTVHRGGTDVAGGLIMRRPLDGSSLPYLVLPDDQSISRQRLLRGMRQQSDNPTGEEWLSASFDPAAQWLITGGSQGTVMLLDLRNPEFRRGRPLDPFQEDKENATWVDGFVVPVRFLRGMTGGVTAVSCVPANETTERDAAFSPDKGVLVGLDGNAGLRLWDMAGRRKNYVTEDWAGTAYSYAVAFHPTFGLITTSNRGEIRTWEIESPPLAFKGNAYFKTLGGEGFMHSIRALDVKGSLMAVALRNNRVQLLDLENPGYDRPLGHEDEKSPHAGGLWSVRFRPGDGPPDSRFDLASGDAMGRVVFWDLTTPSESSSMTGSVSGFCQFSGRIRALSFHPEGRWLLVGTSVESPATGTEPYGEIHLLDLERKDCPSPSSGSCGAGPCIAGSIRHAGGESGGVPRRVSPVRSVAFSPDGTKFAAGGDHGMVRCWDFKAGEGFRSIGGSRALRGAQGLVNSVLFVPVGDEKVAAVGQDGALRLWDLEESENSNPLVLRQPGTEMHALAVTPDGRYLAAGDARGRFHIWDMDTTACICRLLLRNLTWREWHAAVRDDDRYRVVCPDRPIPGDVPAPLLMDGRSGPSQGP
ncbi:MAG: hypothetical protein GX443_17690 [Deltaproteobacteria bacterium]|nr:hypothetical protein [Deltaproteobacteria bacterium]